LSCAGQGSYYEQQLAEQREAEELNDWAREMTCRIKCRKCGEYFDLDDKALGEHGRVCQTEILAGMALGQAADRQQHELEIDRQISTLDSIAKQDVTPAMINQLSDAQVKELLRSLVRAGRIARQANSRLIKMMKLGQKERKYKIKESWKHNPDRPEERDLLRTKTREMINEQLRRQKRLISIDVNLRQRYFEVGTWQVTRVVSKEIGVDLQEMYSRLPTPMNARQDPHNVWRDRVRAQSSPCRRAYKSAHGIERADSKVSNNPQDATTEHGVDSVLDRQGHTNAKELPPCVPGSPNETADSRWDWPGVVNISEV
jgi:hypothetical protein